MCDKCNNIPKNKFIDRSINTADFDRLLIIGQQSLTKGESIELNENKIIIKGTGGQFKVAQMISAMFNRNPEVLELFEMAKELMPIMKQKTM
jgi:hypothetical protein